jgi:ABC-type polysaccharide/polyol phosphate export permease
MAEAKTQSPQSINAVVPDPGVFKILQEVVSDFREYRDLLYQLTLRDIRIRYKQAVMGFGWAVFLPALVVLAGVLVRGAMAYISGRELETAEIVGVAVKSVPWSFFVGAIGFATNSLTGNGSLVTKIYFPREVFPVGAVLAQTFDSTIGAIALVLVLPFLGVTFGWSVLWVPVLAVLLFLFTTAVGIFLACGNLFFRDVKYIVRVLLTFGIFFTPVFFEPAMFGPTGAWAMMLNPLAPILEGIRLSVVEHHNLLQPLWIAGRDGGQVIAWEPWFLAYSAAWALFGLLGATVMFHRLEYVFAEYV